MSVGDYRHSEKRPNNPPAKLAPEGAVPPVERPRYEYDPHRPPALRFDPEGEHKALLDKARRQALSPEEADRLEQLLCASQPWLEWAGKREEHERGGFSVDPVALHIHERHSAQAILHAAQRQDIEQNLFAAPNLPYHQQVQFYRHQMDWANRLILGDSREVMASLAHREDLAGKVQMIYLDPPYGIKFASNFQPEVGRRDVKDREQDLTREPEMVKAYRDTWRLGIHSYLSYLRDRLSVAKELLADSGSIFVQISDENLHRVRQVMDEVFGAENFVSQIAFKKTAARSAELVAGVADYQLWYAKNREQVKYRPIFEKREWDDALAKQYRWFEQENGQRHQIATESVQALRGQTEYPGIFRPVLLTSSHEYSRGKEPIEIEGQEYLPGSRYWSSSPENIARLAKANRVFTSGSSLNFVRHLDDFAYLPLDDMWTDAATGGGSDRYYVVQTTPKVVQRCMLMTTDPGDLVLDPTCGSGTTAAVAERWGRRWITIDTSRVAIAIARQRLLTGVYERFRVQGEGTEGHRDEGTEEGEEALGVDPSPNFVYKSVPHITLGSIAQNEALDPIFTKHQPILDQKLAACNQALAEVDEALREKLTGKLAAKMQAEGVRAATDADRRRWLLAGTTKEQIASAFAPHGKLKAKHVREALAAVPADGGFEHWQVPFDTDEDWPRGLKEAVQAYRAAWRAKMDEVNACIAEHAEQEELVDQPEVVRGVSRVSGPFTVEAVQPPEMTLDDGSAVEVESGGMFGGEPEEMQTWNVREVAYRPDLDPSNVEAHLETILRLLKADGVRFPNNKAMRFTWLEPLYQDGAPGGLHAEGRWEPVEQKDEGTQPRSDGEEADDGPATVGVVIGPPHGEVTSKQVVDAIRPAIQRGYAHLVFAGFGFSADASTEIEQASSSKIQLHRMHINPDVNPAMDGLLRDPARPGQGQLFTVFGQPRASVSGPDSDGQYQVTMEGVDIYDPVKHEVSSTGAGKVAAWFLDGDFDGRTFCATQVFFPDKSAWEKLARALRDTNGAVDSEAFEKLSGTESLPFEPGEHQQAAVKVIDPRGNEVMTVVELGEG